MRGELLENVLKLSRSSILGTNHDKSIENGVSQDFNQDFIIIYLISCTFHLLETDLWLKDEPDK